MLGEEEGPTDEKEDKKVLITVYLCMTACQLMFLSIASFMPNYKDEKHPSISNFEMGFILS